LRNVRRFMTCSLHCKSIGAGEVPSGTVTPDHNELQGMRHLALSETLRPLAAEDGKKRGTAVRVS
jgi:hypothetical protein